MDKKNEAGISQDGGSVARDDRKKKSRPFGKKGLIITLIVLLLILGGTYIGGAKYYETRLFRNTTINTYSVGNMTVEEAEDTFTGDLAAHQITVREKAWGTQPARKEIIKAQDVGVSIDVGNQIRDLKDSQNKWLWINNFFGSTTSNIHLDVTFDEDKVSDVVGNMECFKKENVDPPVDCYIEAGENEFAIVPEVLGNRVKKKKLKEAVKEALTNCVTSIDLEKQDLYHLPKYYETDKVVKDALDKANKYSHSSITFDYKYKTDTLDYEKLKDWIVISKDFKVKVSKASVGDYVADMQTKYNTMGVARKFKNANGEEITIVEGDYGWKVNFEKEKEKLYDDVKSGKTLEREPEWEYRGVVRDGERDDIGGTYVEVSLNQQEVWMFVDGKCIASDSCVTGNPTKGAGTTPGIYSITFKKTPATLTGPNANGSQYSSDVTYWMPFNGNQGLHDAPWRHEFGGNIYKSNGSHGCVNLPFSMAKTIWDHVEAGYPVIIY